MPLSVRALAASQNALRRLQMNSPGCPGIGSNGHDVDRRGSVLVHRTPSHLGRDQAATQGVQATGALGPAEAFGVASLERAVAEAGFHRQP